MNLKSTLKTALLFGVSLNGKINYHYKSLPFFMGAILVVLSFLPAKAFPTISERLPFSTKLLSFLIRKTLVN